MSGETSQRGRHARYDLPGGQLEAVSLPLRLKGAELLNQPMLNKGTAFSDEERNRLALHGLLPPHVESLDEQVVRAYEAYQRKNDDLERHIFLRALQDTNEVLFYRLVLDHLVEMMPIVYTPVVGQACQQFSHIYRRARGLYIPYPLRDHVATMLRNRPFERVDVIVVTDGERILGIGDQGAGGLGIPIGKLALYSLIGGIRPDRTLPIMLDVGTNNPERLRDPEYIGWQHERVGGADYLEFVDQFVRAVRQELPDVLLQWEDFAAVNARTILHKYRDQMLTFNDDIQGTASIVLATILSAMRVTKERIQDQEVVIFGAGSAAVGVADFLVAAAGEAGVPAPEMRRRIWLVNRGGLVHSGRPELLAEQRNYAQPWDRVATWSHASPGRVSLEEVISHVTATTLIGLSTVGRAFNESLVREMGRKVRRPIIMPLSNPTANSEATPEDLLRWTEGRALIATGSPFLPVRFEGAVVPIAQCNNVYIFPAVGLAAVAARSKRVTDGMFLAASRALVKMTPETDGRTGALLPPLTDLRAAAKQIAIAVGLEAQRAGVAPRTSPEDVKARVEAHQWKPVYPDFLSGV